MTIWPPPPQGNSEPTVSPSPTLVRQFLNWFFEEPAGKRTVWSIILWWERRRIAYNLIVGMAGLCSLFLFFFFIIHSATLKPGEDAVEPMAVIAVPFLMNLCYSGGVFLEIVLFWVNREQTQNVGPNLLRAGFYFSLVVVFIPSVIWGVTWIGHVL